jgi:hypothetical protein
MRGTPSPVAQLFPIWKPSPSKAGPERRRDPVVLALCPTLTVLRRSPPRGSCALSMTKCTHCLAQDHTGQGLYHFTVGGAVDNQRCAYSRLWGSALKRKRYADGPGRPTAAGTATRCSTDIGSSLLMTSICAASRTKSDPANPSAFTEIPSTHSECLGTSTIHWRVTSRLYGAD